jgi:Reverse transcriptase (RNA-dependent DNA polymerase)
VTNEEKAKVFHNAFFATPDEPDSEEIEETDYPEPAFKFKPITDDQIKRAIACTSPYKAPGANSIPNIILKQCADMIIPIIGPIFRATFSMNTYPEDWKNSITLVVKKPAKPSYADPGAYRPIALLDTIGKVLSSCIAEDLSKYAELHNLLPANHFGCRPGRTTTDALHYMATYIKDAWRRGEVVGALFLDIKAASRVSYSTG